MRNILTYHVIFHWNRMGLTDITQSILAHRGDQSYSELITTLAQQQ